MNPQIPAGLPNQFVNWRMRDGRKVPCTPTGVTCDHTDPANHLNYATAAAAPFDVAFVLTEDDGWFFIDMDKCLEENGQWSQAATNMFTSFNGAWGEVSQSGQGLHIMGRCDANQLKDRRNKWGGWLEFYVKDRFIAFSKNGWQAIGGQARDIDWTRILQDVVPERPFLGNLPDGREETYTGPEDDEELIAMMLRNRNVASQFGEGVSAKDLWEANAEKLGVKYPPYDCKDPFDHSSADAALMSHLAFWTGKDMPLMERLFSRSALNREKWEKRKDYRRDTVQNAARLCTKWYDRVKKKSSDNRQLDERSSVNDIAHAFVQSNEHAGLWLHDHKTVTDYCFCGTRWQKCETDELLASIRLFIEEVVNRPKANQERPSHWEEVRKAVRLDRRVAVVPDELDADPNLINTPKGTIDLRSGTLRPHQSADRITQITAVSPVGYQNSRWARFVDEICGGDSDLVRFLQTALGASLSGATGDHWFAFIFGQGRNGKSILVETIAAALGTYAILIPSHSLMSSRNQTGRDAHAQLQGKRFVYTSEVDPGAHFDEALLKNLTGDKLIPVRELYKNTYVIPRTFKLFINGNHRPQVRTDDTAMRSRLKLVRLSQDFSGDKGEAGIEKTLQAELGCVLQWLIDGHGEYLANKGLPACNRVDAEIRKYFSMQVTVEQWIDERLSTVTDDGRPVSHWPKSSDLFSDYRSWCDEMGSQPVNQTRWADAMDRNDITRAKSNGVRYAGVELKSGLRQSLPTTAPF